MHVPGALPLAAELELHLSRRDNVGAGSDVRSIGVYGFDFGGHRGRGLRLRERRRSQDENHDENREHGKIITLINQILKKFVLFLAIYSFTAGITSGQEAVEPDRPDVTNGTHIVDIGLLQLEIGGLYTHAAVGEHAAGTPITARVGLADWLEARIGTDGFLAQQSGSATATGLGNLQIGAKLRLWADPGGLPVLSILPAVNVPTASADKGLGSGAADYTLAVLTGKDIARHAHVDVNYGIGAIGVGEGAPHFLQHLVSISASAAVTDNWNPYVEAFWFSREEVDGRASVAMDAGAIYELGERYALDGGVQLGVTSNAPRIAVFGGVTIIVGDILGGHGVHARQRQLARRRRP
jgi:outer membrane putative beta-barrel porin/alpha-amylase